MDDPHVALVAAKANTIIEAVFATLEEIRAGLEERYRDAPRFHLADLAAVRPEIFGCLRSQHGVVAGAGVIVAPGLLADRARWLDWWQTPPEDDPVFLDVDLDPESPDFYDYTAAEWYAGPERTRHRHVAGPYVDYGGTDTYMLTLTTPAQVDGRFLGVVGADVRAARFESLLLGVLAACPTEVALVNDEGRVVAANSPRRPAGSLLQQRGVRLAGLPWSIVCAEPLICSS